MYHKTKKIARYQAIFQVHKDTFQIQKTKQSKQVLEETEQKVMYKLKNY